MGWERERIGAPALTVIAIVALATPGCERKRVPTEQHPGPVAQPKAPVDAGPRALVDLSVGCTPMTMQPVASVLASAAHPCQRWVKPLYGRLASVWGRFGGTYWAVNAAGAGLFVTCRHCTDTLAGLRAPQGSDKTVAAVGLPPVLVDGAIRSVHEREHGIDRQAMYLPGYTLFAPAVPANSKDKLGNLNVSPRDDFVVMAVPGEILRPPSRKPWMTPPTTLPATPVIFADPHKLTRAPLVTGAPIAGEPILALGFPRASGSQMTATVSTVLADDEAARMVSRAEPEESRLEYDPRVEFLFPAQSTAGLSGGGVFDRFGRYLGVMVRGNTTKIHGRYFTRVVRATYIAAQLKAALSRADAELRDRVKPLVESVFR